MDFLLFATIALGIAQVAFSTDVSKIDDGSDLFNVTRYIQADVTGAKIDIQPIPETDLHTGIYYKLSMRSFPSGFLTWTVTEHINKWNYVQVRQEEITPMPDYVEGGKYHKDVQFAFVPSSVSGYYEIINRGRPGKKLAISRSETVDKGYYLVVDPKVEDRPEGDSLFKPVKVDPTHLKTCKDVSCESYYQLKSLSFPNGAVTYTMKRYGNDANYVIIDDDSKDKEFMSKYEKGGVWYRHTFFLWDPATE